MRPETSSQEVLATGSGPQRPGGRETAQLSVQGREADGPRHGKLAENVLTRIKLIRIRGREAELPGNDGLGRVQPGPRGFSAAPAPSLGFCSLGPPPACQHRSAPCTTPSQGPRQDGGAGSWGPEIGHQGGGWRGALGVGSGARTLPPAERPAQSRLSGGKGT